MSTPPRASRRDFTWFMAAILLPVPWTVAAAFGGLGMDPVWVASLAGLAILGAAFMLSWSCEVAERDIPQSLALLVLALVGVLPEYAVDISFAHGGAAALATLMQQQHAAANQYHCASRAANILIRAIVKFGWLTWRNLTRETLGGALARTHVDHTITQLHGKKQRLFQLPCWRPPKKATPPSATSFRN